MTLYSLANSSASSYNYNYYNYDKRPQGEFWFWDLFCAGQREDNYRVCHQDFGCGKILYQFYGYGIFESI